jgi:hypothetical protein
MFIGRPFAESGPVSKLLLLSVCLALVGIPLFTARDVHPSRGLKRALIGVAAFNVFYLFLVRFVIPRLG